MDNKPDEFNEEDNKATETKGEEPVIVSEKPKKRKNRAMIAIVAFGALIVVTAMGAMAVAVVVFLSGLKPDTKLIQTESTTSAESVVMATDGSKHFSIEDASALPDSGGKVALSTIEIASNVSPATVSIIAEVSYGSIYGESLYESSGSGFIISSDGYIVTNNHVVSGAGKISVVIPGFEDSFSAEIVGTDSQTDIAVLKVESNEAFQYIVFGDSDLLQVGELAVAIGNPFGELAGTVTVGVISALDRDISIDSVTYNLLQTDASINSGNSGGPLVNSYGEVIGVTNAKISDGEGIGFAIPINDVKNIIEELINNGYVSGRPVMGVVVVDVDESTAQQYDWPVGVYVREVTVGGPAEKAGVLMRDIITEINGQPITSTQSVIDIRDHLVIGEVMTLTVFRDGETLSLTLVLEEGKAN
jgi:serine protease Do